MSGESAFQVEGVVKVALANGTWQVELANGHRLVAFAPGRAWAAFAGLVPGSKVKLQMSPCDLSQGRIMSDTKRI